MIKRFLLWLIRIYQRVFSYDHGIMGKLYPNVRHCRFLPTCSQYSYEAIEKYGVIKGVFMSIKRILKCNPWNKSDRYDPVC